MLNQINVDNFAFAGLDSPAFIIIFCLLIGIGILVSLFFLAFIWCKMFSKAGYSWALGLLILVPFGNMIMPCVLAFGDWPVNKKLRKLKEKTENNNQDNLQNTSP